MLNNYYTLVRLGKEIGDMISGSTLVRSTTRIKGTLELIFSIRSDAAIKITISCVPRENFVFAEEISGTRNKGANVLPELVGDAVRQVGVFENERQFFIEFENHGRLIAALYGSSANVYSVSPESKIINSFLKPNIHMGKNFISGTHQKEFPEDAYKLLDCLRAVTGSPTQRLSRCIPTIDATLSREVLYRYSVSKSDGPGPDLGAVAFESGENISGLLDVLSDLRNELDHPSPCIYTMDGRYEQFALIALRHLGNEEFIEYSSVNECIRDFVTSRDRIRKSTDLKSRAVHKLQSDLYAMRNTLSKIEADIAADRASRHQASGEFLMSNLEKIRKGEEKIVVVMDGDDVEVRLDPALTPVQNAQSYFAKAKRARMSIEKAKDRRKALQMEIGKVETSIKELESGSDVPAIREIKSHEKEKDDIRFRIFEKDGYKIYVGKDAKNNDELTFGFAKPNDVFLHARGVSGSHVIIRNASREYPQKSVIRHAAGIAAHYSKARTSGIVPVAFTMRKFVRKAKGKPGAVFLDREETIFVKPGIPPA